MSKTRHNKKSILAIILYSAGLVVAVVLFINSINDKKKVEDSMDVSSMTVMPSDAVSKINGFVASVEAMPNSKEKSEFLSFTAEAREDHVIREYEYMHIKNLHHALQASTDNHQ